MLQAGNYKVTKVLDCFVGESKEKKTPFFCLELELNGQYKAPWIVYIKEEMNDKARDMAIRNAEALAVLGFKGKTLADMAEASVDEVFGEISKDVSVVVEMESFKGQDGTQKEKARIKFVNVSGSGLERMEKKQAIVTFKGVSFNNFLVKARKENPIKENQDEEVPF